MRLDEEEIDLGVDYIIEAGIKAKCDIECITKALLIYHNFMRYIENIPYDSAMVAASALYLSSKAVEKKIDINGLIFLFYHMVNGTVENLYPGTMKFNVLKKSLITVVYIMQRMLVFNLHYSVAHQYLVPFLNVLHNRLKNPHEGLIESITGTCMKLINDFYTHKMCLNYKPADICIVCIDIAMHRHGVVYYLQSFHPWFNGFSDLTEEKADEIKAKFLCLYKDETLSSDDEDKLSSLSEKDNDLEKE